MKRHDLDLFSLVAGLVFLAVAVGHLVDVSSWLDVNGQYVVPVARVATTPRLARAPCTNDRPDPVTDEGADDD